jgi:hypothetical protein
MSHVGYSSACAGDRCCNPPAPLGDDTKVFGRRDKLRETLRMQNVSNGS